ncbi:MAG: hypothetical protein ACLPV8_24030 [Steroidobacteraceae bacterium]
MQAPEGDGQVRDRSVVQGGTIDLGVMTRIVRAEPFTFLLVLLVCVAVSILYLHAAKTTYAVRMEIISASADQQKSGGLGGALASIAGLTGGAEGSPQFRIFLGSLRSPVAAEAIVSNQDLLRAIFYREWSETDDKWREPPSRLRPVSRVVGRILGWRFAKWGPPGVSRVFDYLNDELKVIPDAKSGVVTLQIDSDRPDVAERVLLTLDKAMNERLRERDLEHATKDIDYLSKRLAEVNVVEYRTALVSNLAEQEKARMQASAPLPYASDVLGRPMISTRPVSPKPLVVWGAGIILGGLLGFWAASFKYHRR